MSWRTPNTYRKEGVERGTATSSSTRPGTTSSKTIKDVAVAYGVGPETLRNWLNKYREANGGTEAELTLSERARLKELERVVADLRAETAFLKKASAYFAREQRP